MGTMEGDGVMLFYTLIALNIIGIILITAWGEYLIW